MGDPREKRDHYRALYKIEVSLSSEHNFYNGFSENISEGGIFVATYEPLPVGSRVGVIFAIEGQEYDLVGEVCWIREHSALTRDVQPGMGVKFVQMYDDAREAIAHFVNKRAPIFYED